MGFFFGGGGENGVLYFEQINDSLFVNFISHNSYKFADFYESDNSTK